MTVETRVHVSTDAPTDWEPFDVPAEDILDGDFEGKVHWLRQSANGDGQLLTGIFTGTPSRFRYTFGGDETFHVIEGRVTIELDEGGSATLEPGSVASFPKGAGSVWTVHAPFRKFFVISG